MMRFLKPLHLNPHFRKKSKLDETLEKNEAFKLEERVIVFVMTLSKKDHKKELVKD